MLEYTNNTTGYEIVVADDADLLTSSEETSLAEDYMSSVSAYGNVAFVSVESNPSSSTESYAKQYLAQEFGDEDSVVFMIDMDYHYIYIYSTGDLYDVVTKSKAETITDNVYSYASKGDYYKCAAEGFTQIGKLCSGSHINQPMRFCSSALIAIVLAFLINYFVVKRYSHGKKPSSSQLIDGIFYKFNVLSIQNRKVGSQRFFSPLSRGRGPDGGGFHGGGMRGGGFPGGGFSGGGHPGGGGFSGGGGHGGGGSHGGGGGHRF